MFENQLSKIIVDAAFQIHTTLGPGLLESAYEHVLAYELQQHGLSIVRQKHVSIIYKGIRIKDAFRPDIIVEDKVIIEVKSVEALADIHAKQLRTYLRLTEVRLGLLINFNVELIKNGIRRVVNEL